jgi:hypothetical protein
VYNGHLWNEEQFADAEERLESGIFGLLGVLNAATIEQTMLQGLEDTLEAAQIATNPDEPDIEGAAGRWVAQRLTTFYPNFLKKVEDFRNGERETGRDLESAIIASTQLEGTLNAMFGLEYPRVMTRRNMLGEPIRTDAVLSAFGVVATEREDPIREELQKIMETTGIYLNNMPPRREGMDLRQQLTDAGDVTIFEAWQANLQEVGLRDQLETLMDSEFYRQSTYGRRRAPGGRTSQVQRVFETARANAWQLTLSQNPEFTRQFYLNKAQLQIREYQ